MPRWIRRALARIHQLAAVERIAFTQKALDELRVLPLDLDALDACHILLNLNPRQCACRVLSRDTAEWLYIFKPRIAGVRLYVKLVLRGHCTVISFHEDLDNDHEQEGQAG